MHWGKLLLGGALAWASMLGAGTAATVTAPNGGVHMAGAPMTVAWSGVTSGNGIVNLELTLTRTAAWPGTISLPWIGGVANTGSYVGPLPKSLCDNASLQPISQWTAYVRVRSPTGGGDPFSGPFSVSCPKAVGPVTEAGNLHPNILPVGIGPGTVTVTKIVVNATRGPAPPYPTFDMTLVCTPPSGARGRDQHTAISIKAGATEQVSAVAANSACHAEETTLPPIQGLRACQGQPAVWTTSYSPASVIVPPGGVAALTVTNTLSCQ